MFIHRGLHYYALFYYRRAMMLRPDDARMWCAMAQCYDLMGRKVEAESCAANHLDETVRASQPIVYPGTRCSMEVDRWVHRKTMFLQKPEVFPRVFASVSVGGCHIPTKSTHQVLSCPASPHVAPAQRPGESERMEARRGSGLT